MIEKKIYSAVDATEELVGTYGHFGETVNRIELKIEKVHKVKPLCKIEGKESAERFVGYCNWQTYPLYMPVCTEENKDAYDAWLNYCPVSKIRENVKYTYVRGGGVEPDFLNDTLFVQKEEKQYVPFDTIDEFIDASGVTNKNCVGKGIRPFIWVKGTETKAEYLVTGYKPELNAVRVGSGYETLQSLFDMYTFLDGSPCGKEAE